MDGAKETLVKEIKTKEINQIFGIIQAKAPIQDGDFSYFMMQLFMSEIEKYRV